REEGLSVDEEAFNRLKKRHEDISRGQGVAHQVALNVSGGLPETADRPKWSGLQCDGKILGWIENNQFLQSGALPEGKPVGLLVDQTCFYAEAGGQVGDMGTITTPTGVFEVAHTVKVGNAIVHLGEVVEGRVEAGQAAKLQVDPVREFTRKNHTATHLLH